MGSKIKDNILIVKNPVSNQEIAKISICSKEQLISIIDKSHQFKDWANLSLNKRCHYINLFRKQIVKHKEDLLQTIISETGKKDFDAFVELLSFLEHVKEITKIAKKALRKSPRNSGLMKNKKSYVKYEPIGIAGIISPWNYPLTTPISSTIEALLAGNNVILKPSEHTPLTPLYIKKLWDEVVGFNNAFQIIIGGGEQGSIIVESKMIDIICFTSSTKIGKKIAKKCGELLKPVILELGGKDPMIVLKDAGLDRAVESALYAGYSNAGQTCISVEEVFIEDQIYNKFVEKISRRVKTMSSGDKSGMEIGAMIMEENCNKVKEHISEIKDQNRIIQGKQLSHDMYIAPTLILNPDENLRIVNEETFGPVISLRKFRDKEDLLQKVHKTGYGLSASIFGTNKNRIHSIISKLKTGNVSINDVFTHYGIASLPFGGEGQSGLGRLHGKEGLRSLSRTKSIVENRFNFINEPFWFSRSKRIENFLKKIVNVFYK